VAAVVCGANRLLVHGSTGYQFDPQGNAAHLLNQNGTVVAHLAYDAWGQRMSGTNPTPYGYKGQWGYHTDGETGLLLLTHRYLDPATGRFLTRDPIGFEGACEHQPLHRNGTGSRRTLDRRSARHPRRAGVRPDARRGDCTGESAGVDWLRNPAPGGGVTTGTVPESAPPPRA